MDDKAEFVRSIWLRLGVGDDGYLSLADLTKVCHAIGMEDDAKELFTRLDLDGDGRISFAEFQHLFQKRSPEIDFSDSQQTSSASIQPPSSPQIVSPLSPSPRHSVWQSEGRDKSGSTKPGRGGGGNKGTPRCSGAPGMSRSLDEQPPNAGAMPPLLLPPEAAGTSPRTSTRSVAVWRVLQQWEGYGIRDGRALLHYLGLPSSPSEEITQHDLVAAVEEECLAAAAEEQHAADRKTSTLLANKRALCSLLLLETKQLRTAVESACCERDKLRADLAHTSHRLSSQAQELDDHTMALEATAHQHIQSVEKQHQEAVRALQERLYSEREAREQACAALSDAGLRADHLQEQLTKTRSLLAQTEQACERLESENSELTAKLGATRASLADAQALNARLQHRDHQHQDHDADTGDCRRSLGAATSLEGVPDDPEWRELCAQVAKLRHDNQALRDSNDELQARIEQLTLQQPSRLHHANVSGADISLDGSCIGDYLLPGGVSSSVLASPPPASAAAVFSDPTQHQPSSMPAVWSISGVGVKRPAVGGGEDTTWSSPCDVSSAGRRSSPDLLSPRAGKIARCASSPPPPYASTSGVGVQLGSSSQPASLELHLASLSSSSHSDPRTDDRGPASHHRRVASASSVVTSCALSSDSIVSACASAPQSSRRSRGVGLEAELAGVRVEVAGLVQQRHHLAVCVSRLQKQLDAQLAQWNGWEKALRKYIAELEGGEKALENTKQNSSGMSGVKPDGLSKVSSADDVFNHSIRSFSSEVSLASQVLQPSASSSICLLSPVAGGNESATCRELPPTSDTSNTGKAESDLDRSGPGRPALDASDMLSEESIAGPSKHEGGEVLSEESSGLQESPCKPPSDLLSLLSLLRSAVRALLEKEALRRQAVEEELNSAERQKAELSDKLMQLHTELQGVRAELEKSEEYWLLKLQDEQDYYEEERRVYDEKFAELEAKIVAYETEELNKNSEISKQRLSPIDESVLFEQQVNELELEVLEAQRLQAMAEAERDSAVELQRLAEEQLAALWLEIEKTDTKESSPMHVDAADRSTSVESVSLKSDDERPPLPDTPLDTLQKQHDASVDAQEFKSSGEDDLQRANLKLEGRPCTEDRPSEDTAAVNGGLHSTEPPTSTKDAQVQTQPLFSLGATQPWDEKTTSSGSSCERLQQTEVLRQLHESCQQLHAAQHTATLARTQLEALHSRMEEHVEKSLAAAAAGEDGGRADLVPVAALAAVIKGCREQQKLQVMELERALADAHHHLQHHASQHTQQMRRAERADKLLAELFLENSELMRALHLTEARQKRAEHQLRSIN